MLELDRATHKYSNGLPAVTEILAAAGIIDSAFYTEEGKERGTAVHLACELYDQGDLDELSIDPRIAGYLEAYKCWRRLAGIEFDWIETPVDDKAHTYAGMPDKIRCARPRRIIDLKTGAFQRWHPVQLAAYLNCLDDPFSYERQGLYLQENGKFSVRPFPKSEYMADLAIFQSALNIYYWKELR